MTVRSALASAEDEVHKIASKLEGVRECPKGAEANRKATTDRAEDAEGSKRERDKAERLSDILLESEIQRSGIIVKLQGFQSDREDFNQRMEDLEVRGYKKV